MANGNDKRPTDFDLHNVIDTKARQLKALLENTYGGGGEAFRGMNDQLQDNYMWACADMADAIVESLDELCTRSLAGMKAEVQHG